MWTNCADMSWSYSVKARRSISSWVELLRLQVELHEFNSSARWKNAFFSYLCQWGNPVRQTALHPGKYFPLFILQDRSCLPCIFGLLERSWGEVRSGGISSEQHAGHVSLIFPAECANLARPVWGQLALSPERLRNWLLGHQELFFCLLYVF